MTFLGTYTLYPAIYTALAINTVQDNLRSHFDRASWRAQVLSEPLSSFELPQREYDDAEMSRRKKAYVMLWGMQRYLRQTEGDTTFSLLGVTVTKARFVSLGVSLAAAVGSWVSSLL